MKKILFNTDARLKIKNGIDKCCDVVKVSLGGNGKNVLIYNGSTSQVINDGVSIAKEVEVKDEIEMAGIQLAKQCANQTNDDAGDGTTTTLVLLQSILNEIISDFQTDNPRELREELFKEADKVLKQIKPSKIKTKKDVYNLALTSSLEPKIAEILSNVYSKLGKDAKISIEEVAGETLECEVLEGIKFDSKPAEKQLLSAYDKTIHNDIDILVKDKVETQQDLQEKITEVVNAGEKKLLVISNYFDRNVLLSIIRTNDFKIIPIEYEQLKDLEDIEDFTGGKAKKVIIEEENTTIIGGVGDVKKKIEFLKGKLDKEQSHYEKEELERRIANLTGGVAIIRVGKRTDVERHELVLKIEDAIGTVKGAYELGYVTGGGMALKVDFSDTRAGKIIKTACEAPYKQICDNYGGEIKIEDTVVDSFKTVKSSLLNALSTATSILTVEAALIEENEDES